MDKVLVILGPTATGKTDLALSLAKKFNGELVSCDSRQVYKGLDIGTGKESSSMNHESSIKRGDRYWEISGIKIWVYDVVNPKKQYTVADYVKDADGVIEDIRKRGKLPIIVGGTGLYLKALLYGLPNLAVPVDPVLRKQLEKLSLNELQGKLQAISMKGWEKMNQSDRGNPRRLIRAIELSARSPSTSLRIALDILKIGLTASRLVLYKRVDQRVVSRIKQGMIEEARDLHKNGLSLKRMKQLGLEYGVLADYLNGEIQNKKDLTRIMQGKIHGYVRRQLTWFKKEKNVHWLNITEKDLPQNVEKIVAKWYHPRTYAKKN